MLATLYSMLEGLYKRLNTLLAVKQQVQLRKSLAETAGAPRMGSVYFAFYLRAMGSGRPRRFDELQSLLERAGFVAAQQENTRIPMLASVIHARVPD